MMTALLNHKISPRILAICRTYCEDTAKRGASTARAVLLGGHDLPGVIDSIGNTVGP